MNKKKILKKHGASWQDIKEADFDISHVKFEKHTPSEAFKDHAIVGKALLESLEENDTEGFIEILDAYLRINRRETAKEAKIARSTVQQMFSKKGNPTLKTIAKIVHHAKTSQGSLKNIKY